MNLGMIVVCAISFVVGIVGFAQVFWSMQMASRRGAFLTAATSASWILIMLGTAFGVYKLAPEQMGNLVWTYIATFSVVLISQLIKKIR